MSLFTKFVYKVTGMLHSLFTINSLILLAFRTFVNIVNKKITIFKKIGD